MKEKVMWGRKSGNNTDMVLKEALLRQLSHTVKEVQLHHNQTRETCTTQEETSALLCVLEAIFLHSLKRSFLESARKTVAVTDDVRPAPSFFEVVRPVTHKDTIAVILQQKLIKTNVGRSRVWIRLALNESAITSYLTALSRDRIVSKHYKPTALLRDREALDTAARLLDGIVSVPFEIPLNSSILNTWSSEPLLISGLWSPAIRNSAAATQVAEDVVESLREDETCSIPTPSSSVRSLFTLNEDQAFDIIFKSPMFQDQAVLPEEMSKEVEKTMNELETERNLIMQRSFSTLLESCSPQTDSILTKLAKQEKDRQELNNSDLVNDREEFPSETNVSGEKSGEAENSSPQLDDTPKPTEEVQKPLEDDFAKLLGICKEKNEAYLPEPPAENKAPEIDKKPSLENIIMNIPREKGLKEQKFECADCQLSIGLNFGPALLCHVTGDYLCDNCHKATTGVVPSRIIYNWDHNKYPIGEKANDYLISRLHAPIFDLETINPKLYKAVADMQEVLHLRKQLNFLNLYVRTCKEQTELPIRDYIVRSVHLYSLADLMAVPGGMLKAELKKVVAVGRSHVVKCWICKAKGFICEVCQDPQVIYPFDDDSIYRCGKCQAVYHGQCLANNRVCPKCKRKKQRLENNT